MLEACLSDALRRAGERLAEALRAVLISKGLPDTLDIVIEEGRVTVASRSKVLRDMEAGRAGAPPVALFEATARETLPAILDSFRLDIQGWGR